MIKFIKHRSNTLEAIRDENYDGFEIDIRTINNRLICHHDPFTNGVYLENILREIKNRFVILNVKEDGLEQKIMELMQTFNLSEYFFLDQPVPTIIRSITLNIDCAVRFSEYEYFELNKNVLPKWIWIDSFTGSWEHLTDTLNLADKWGIQTCLVSPELQGRFSIDEFEYLKSIFKDSFIPYAICTKDRNYWSDL